MVEVLTFVEVVRNKPCFIGFWVECLTLRLYHVKILNVRTKKSNVVVVVPKVTTEAQEQKKFTIACIDLSVLIAVTAFLIWTGVRVISEVQPDWMYKTMTFIGGTLIGSMLVYRQKTKSVITAFELVDIKFSPPRNQED